MQRTCLSQGITSPSNITQAKNISIVLSYSIEVLSPRVLNCGAICKHVGNFMYSFIVLLGRGDLTACWHPRYVDGQSILFQGIDFPLHFQLATFPQVRMLQFSIFFHSKTSPLCRKKKKKVVNRAKDTTPFSRAGYIRIRSILQSINSLLINYMLFQNDLVLQTFLHIFFSFQNQQCATEIFSLVMVEKIMLGKINLSPVL